MESDSFHQMDLRDSSSSTKKEDQIIDSMIQ